MQKYALGLLWGALIFGVGSSGTLRAHVARPVAGAFAFMGSAYVSTLVLEAAVKAPFSLHRYTVDNLLEEAVRRGDYWKARALMLLGADANKKT